MDFQLPVISIVGPTSTGKSALARKVAAKFSDRHVDLLSADSRQVFQGMEIGTGADVEPWSSNTHVHGISFLPPTAEWSVAHFRKFGREILTHSAAEKGVTIIVGGTGLYHQTLWREEAEIDIPPNEELRQKAATLSLSELQEWLTSINPTHWQNMNASDRANPRRLVRALEIAQAPTLPQPELSSLPQTQKSTFCLTCPLPELEARITARVQDRWQNGMQQEVEKLIANYSDEEWKNCPAFSATGYREVRQFIEGTLELEQSLALWSRREFQYAKRQLTWWKKHLPAEYWIDITQPSWQEKVLEQTSATISL